MGTINVLVAVNVGQAIATGLLGNYVFMSDSTGTCVSGQSSSNELVTTCFNGDTIVWQVVSIDPSEQVAILQFTGNAIPDQINPVSYPLFNGTVWGGRVKDTAKHQQYTMELLLNGTKQLSFDPYITSLDVPKR